MISSSSLNNINTSTSTEQELKELLQLIEAAGQGKHFKGSPLWAAIQSRLVCNMPQKHLAKLVQSGRAQLAADGTPVWKLRPQDAVWKHGKSLRMVLT